MRIVIDMQGAQTESRFRGIGRYSTEFAQAICRNRGNHEVILALNGLFPESIDAIRKSFDGLLPQESIVVWQTPGPTRASDPHNEYIAKIAELIREQFFDNLNPDVVHVTSLFEGFVDDAVCSIGNSWTSITYYDLIPLKNAEQYLKSNPLYSKYYYRKLSMLEKASGLLSISEYARQECLANIQIPEQQVINVSTAIGSDFRVLPKELLDARILQNYGVSRPFVMYTGGADERKNLPRLIESFARLPQDCRVEYQLLLAGKMTDFDEYHLRQVATSLGLAQDEIVFTGYIADAELISLYNLCELFVFPSWQEGFGLPVLEAMTCGAPVIASNASSLPEVCNFDQALFDPFDIQAISAAIYRGLTDNAFRHELRVRGIEQSKRFSWDATALKALGFWESRAPCKAELDWKQLSEQVSDNHLQLIKNIVHCIQSHKDRQPTDDELQQIACAIDGNEKVSLDIHRPNLSSQKLVWRLEGPFDSSYSLALLNRELARALHRLGHEVVLHSTEGPGDYVPSPAFMKSNPDLQMLHLAEPQWPANQVDVCSRNLYPPRVTGMNAPVNMMHSYGWEESAFPFPWAEDFNDYLQGMTVMSTHCKKVLRDSGVTLPIEVSGVGVDHWERVTADRSWKIATKKFVFLHVSSCFPRKGADLMLKAYGQAFTSEDDVSLVIKTFPNEHNKIHQWLSDARANCDSYPHVLILEDDLSDAQLKSLYEQSDALLAPSRAEGFGLPMAEAMLSGLPVITTGWSGQTDFCTPETSWLIDYDFEKAETHFGLFGSAWARPNVAHMAKLMREVWHLDPDTRRYRVDKGRKILQQDFKWSDVASRNVSAARSFSAGPKATEALKIGWVSTWNTRCGIAAYSEHLVGNMNGEIHVYAPRTHELIKEDGSNVTRCWDAGAGDDLVALAKAIDEQSPGVIVIQFNYGFFEFGDLASFISNQVALGRVLVIILHSTVDPVHQPDKKLSQIQHALKLCHRILVHSVPDLNRLKYLGLVDNVTLFPHGILDSQSCETPDTPSENKLHIASYGFFLPHKGLIELIEAVGVLRQRGVDIYLDMVNAEYPAAESQQAIRQALAHIKKLNLASRVKLHTRFLPDDECLTLLGRSQLIIFPYQQTGESSSAAVRHGIASGKDVATTPLDIFSDVQEITYSLPGCTPEEIAQGILNWREENQKSDAHLMAIRRKTHEWREQHKYSVIAARMRNLIYSLAESERKSIPLSTDLNVSH